MTGEKVLLGRKLKLGKRYRVVLVGKLTGMSERKYADLVEASMDLSDVTVESVGATNSKFVDMLEGEAEVD